MGSTKIQNDITLITDSKSAIYAIMNHEKYESRQIPINPNTLKFSSGEINRLYFEKLYTNLNQKPSIQFKKVLKDYYYYHIISLLFLMLFSLLLYGNGQLLASNLQINIIAIIVLLAGSLAIFYSINHFSSFLFQAKKLYGLMVLLKMTFFVIADQRVLCRIMSQNCSSSIIPLRFLIISEIFKSKFLFFHCYFCLVIISFYTFTLLLLTEIYFSDQTTYSDTSEIVLISLFLFLQTIEGYQKDIRVKQLF